MNNFLPLFVEHIDDPKKINPWDLSGDLAPVLLMKVFMGPFGIWGLESELLQGSCLTCLTLEGELTPDQLWSLGVM